MHDIHPPALKSNSELKAQRAEQAAERRTRATATAICFSFLVIGWIAEAHGGLPRFIILFIYIVSYAAGSIFSIRSAWEELRQRKVNVDVLMVLAAFGAAAVNEWPEGATLLFLFSLSGTLEQYVLGRTRRAIEELVDLAPAEATLLRDGVEVRVPVEELNIDDIILVRPGERISGEGIIISGSTSVDQSAMTGESVPVERTVNDGVFAGTLNGEGAIQVRVTRRAHETTLARVIQLVEEARSERADSQRFTEWFGERYTFAVLSGAAATWMLYQFILSFPFNEAVYRAMTVLVVASPCAVVISIPAAILSAIACGAREGVLFKGGAHLERLAAVRAIAFDKTGTLTIGKPKLTEIVTGSAVNEDDVLRAAATAESQSEHPLARAIVAAAEERRIQFQGASELQAIVGKGIAAQTPNGKLYVGKASLFEDRGVSVADSLKEAAERLREQGNTAVFVGDEQRVLGVVALADTLRRTAKAALAELRALGVEKLIMLTGDNTRVAEAMAGQLGIECTAELLPDEKVRELKLLRDRYQYIAMIGDGINDAPSLALATVGISLGGTGTAVALETADVVLMADNLLHLPYAISLGRKTVVIIKQNLIFAFSVMGLLLLSTFAGELRLPFAVAGHEGSTVLVILNGLRMLRFKR